MWMKKYFVAIELSQEAYEFTLIIAPRFLIICFWEFVFGWIFQIDRKLIQEIHSQSASNSKDYKNYSLKLRDINSKFKTI